MVGETKLKTMFFGKDAILGSYKNRQMKLTRWIWCTAVIPQWSRFRCQSFCWREKKPWRTYPSNYSTIEARQMRLIVAYLFFDHTANTLKFKKVSITSSTALSELATISRKSTYRGYTECDLKVRSLTRLELNKVKKQATRFDMCSRQRKTRTRTTRRL